MSNFVGMLIRYGMQNNNTIKCHEFDKFILCRFFDPNDHAIYDIAGKY